MRPVKSAEQRNVTIDSNHYLVDELEYIATLDGVFNPYNDGIYIDGLRVSLAHVKAIRVVLDEFGFYRNEVELKNGEHLYVVL